MENKKSINKQLLIIIGLFLLIGGISYALLNFILAGQRNNTISTAKISFSYEETNTLSLTNTDFLTDEEGIISGQDFNFNVSVNNAGSNPVYYLIYLTLDSSNTMNNNFVRFYLNDKTNNKVLGPVSINQLEQNINYNNAYNLYEQGFNSSSGNHEYTLTIWLSGNDEIKNIENNNSQSVIIPGGTFKFKVNVEASPEGNVDFNLDNSGANVPDLASNMIPVYYDSANDVWRKADSTNANSTYKWYSYTSDNSDTTKGMWANAVTVTETNRAIYLTAALGTAISMDDINTMWVWIPRFSAVTPSNYNGGTAAAPGAINVTFVDTNTPAIDAFWWDEDSDGVEDSGEQKSGFWFAKFQTTGTLANSCTTETCNVSGMTIKPNKASLSSQTVSSFFYAGRSMEQINNSFGFISSEVDTHMLKNNEWGAAAYLTQSIYGRCTTSTSCSEVGINNNNNGSLITGYGAPAGSSSEVAKGAYNTSLGINASTTGTIYGIYDMSGGAYEYVMGNYNNTIGSSGFSSMPASKYYNLYTTTSYTGHALTETLGWYSDRADFVYSSDPWFIRGMGHYDTGNAGAFSFRYSIGGAYSLNSFRLSIVK